MLRYLAGVEKLSFEFTNLLAEALRLPPDALKAFYETEMPVQHWAKVVKYPALDNLSSDQGVGPHFDAGFLTFVGTLIANAAKRLTAFCAVAASIPSCRPAGSEPIRRVD